MSQLVARLSAYPRLGISNGTVEALKWLALALMVGDHINKYLLNGTEAWLYDAGRLAMPLFMFVLAYNLARPGALENGAYGRTMIRLAVAGLIATPAFLALGGLVGGWWPLNILFTLFVLTATLRLIEQGTLQGCVTAGLVFAIGGGLVEFWWPALVFGVAIWSYCKAPSGPALLVAVGACASLAYINGNQWALASLLLVLAAPHINVPFARLRWIFYAFYPVHLYLLWIARIKMSELGYLFFT